MPPTDRRRRKREFSLSFSKNVSAGATTPNDTETVEIDMPFDGWTAGLTIVWPASDGGVGVQLRRNEGERLFPRDDKNEFESSPIAFGDTFRLQTEIEQGETLVAEYVNNDSTNSKFTTVILGVEEDVLHGR